MKKEKQKGFTSIELLAAFAIVSVIAVGLLDVVLNYKNKQQVEAIRNEAMIYGNNLQKVIQDDLIKGHLTNVELHSGGKNAIFTMDKPTSYTTTLLIDSTNGVISYGKETEKIKFPIPKIEDLSIDPSSTIETTSSYLKISLILRHPNFSDRDDDPYGSYTIQITCPINYSD